MEKKDLKRGRIVWVSTLILIVAVVLVCLLFRSEKEISNKGNSDNEEVLVVSTTPTPLPSIPPTRLIQNDYHVFQSFNNCAPAALSMALSYYDVHVSQEALADSLRPYHNSIGDNDDKSTPAPELAAEAEKYGLVTYFRADGDMDTIKQFIANDIPVVARTLFKKDEDYAHYRVVKGYDDVNQEIIQDDGYDGKNLRMSYDDWNRMWKPFNYAYLVILPPEKKAIAERILGDELDAKVAWEHAVSTSKMQLALNPNDIEAQFNLSVALYYIGDNEGAVREFEKVEPRLGQHVIWYQIEPIQAYFNVGNYSKVFSLADSILNNRNRAFTELYLLRGKVFEMQGKIAQAKLEYQNAVLYNRNSKEAKEAYETLLR